MLAVGQLAVIRADEHTLCRTAILAGQSIHSGNQKQGLRKWVLSEVTSQ